MDHGILKGKNVILGVGGGIAAYKACDLLRRLGDAGADVHVILTRAAQKFVTPLTFQALSQNPVHTDLFSLTEESEMGHIKLADQADLVIVAPATADLMARAACGLADDLLTTLLLVTRAPVLLAPSMNVNMWEKEVVQNNLALLRDRGFHLIEPGEGYLACGWEGKGRLADPEAVLSRALEVLQTPPASKKKSLSNKKFLINAGPTREKWDPVRFISNPSSGKMGFALAREALARGARVTLVTGPVSLPSPAGLERIDVESAEEMLRACRNAFARCDVFIASAAVGDYRPANPQDQKIKKGPSTLSLKLKKTPDILKTLGQHKKNGQILVGFAAETGGVVANATKKLKQKALDLMVANDVSRNGLGFGSERNQITLIDKEGNTQTLPPMPKTQIATQILDRIERLLKTRA